MSFSNKKDASNLTRGENQDNIAAMMKEAEDAAKEGATPAFAPAAPKLSSAPARGSAPAPAPPSALRLSSGPR